MLDRRINCALLAGVIAERIFCMGINNSLVFDYFKLASEGKPLNEILNHLISEIPFKELNTKRIISEAVHKADSVENLMAILLLREKELDSSDENSVELLFKVIKEVIFEYPPEMILRGLTASPNYSRNK